MDITAQQAPAEEPLGGDRPPGPSPIRSAPREDPLTRRAAPFAASGDVVGRDRELAQVDEFLDGRVPGRRALVLEGGAGIGKTTLWHEAISRAMDRDGRVLSCRPAEFETAIGLSAIADLLSPVADEAFAALPEPQRRALDVARLRVDPDERGVDARSLAAGFHTLLGVLCGAGPVRIAVDDLQWLDRSTAMVIAYAMRRFTDPAAVTGIFSLREPERPPAELEWVLDPRSTTVLPVGPMATVGLHRVLQRQIGASFSQPVLERIREFSGGNPMYALEIGRELARGGPDSPPGPIRAPASLMTLISRRVRELPEPTRDALLTCAALSEPTAASVDLTALSPAETADLIKVTADGRVVFAHPLFASAVYELAPISDRRRAHAQIVAMVSDVEERARHIALAANGPERGVAQAVEDGAGVARRRGAPSAAAELLELAVRLTPRADRVAAHRRRIAAAQAHLIAGDRAHAKRLLDALLSEPLEPGRRAEALDLLAQIAVQNEGYHEAIELWRQASTCTDDERLAISIETGLCMAAANVGELGTGVDHAYAALERAERLAEPDRVAEAAAHVVMLDFLSGNGVDEARLERALAFEDRESDTPHLHRPTTIAAFVAMWTCRLPEARRLYKAAAATARARGDDGDLAQAITGLATVEVRASEFTVATQLLDEASVLAEVTGSHMMGFWAQVNRGWVAAHCGTSQEARAELAGPIATMVQFGQWTAAPYIAAVVARTELTAGNPRAAVAHCEPLVAHLEAKGIGEPDLLFFLPDVIEALVAVSEVPRAEALLDVWERRGRQLERPWTLAGAARCRASIAAARGDTAAALASLETALAGYERLGMPFEGGRVLLAQGILQRRTRQRAAARASLEAAVGVFEDVGAGPMAERARAELERIGLTRSATGELTPTERRVAELVASGMKNRDVAAVLFISPKTVEANLARVYRKLGITSRAELGSRMGPRPQP